MTTVHIQKLVGLFNGQPNIFLEQFTKYIERIMTLDVEKTVQRSFLHLLNLFYKEALTKKSCQPHGPFLVKSVISHLVEIFE